MINVLVVDDSSFMRKSLAYLLESDSSIKVCGVAAEGEEAIRMLKRLKPDVVLLDIAMPVMDGLTALTHIMAGQPTPVLILSGVRDAAVAIKALDLGAIDFVGKPSGSISYDIDTMKEELIYKVKAAAGVPLKRLRRAMMPVSPLPLSAAAGGKERAELVVIGASTGGPQGIATILAGIPRNIGAGILVVQHMAPEFIPSFVERLKWGSQLDVSEAAAGDCVSPGRVLVAPGAKNTVIVREKKKKVVAFDNREPKHQVFPGIDYAMESVAALYGKKALGVLLTGIGAAGADGLEAIKKAGGRTLAEAESSCVVFGMPKAAIERGCVDEVVPLPEMAAAIMGRL